MSWGVWKAPKIKIKFPLKFVYKFENICVGVDGSLRSRSFKVNRYVEIQKFKQWVEF